MSYKTEISDKVKDLLNSVPGLDCTGCWGDCCVSPTMTLVEFIYMMESGKEIFGEPTFKNFLEKPRIEHKIYVGNSHCRFQDLDDGKCLIYPGRALACRLHGHDALRAFESKEMVFCDRNPDKDQSLTQDLLNSMIHSVRELADQIEIAYEEPYFMLSLNLECWIDFYYNESISVHRNPLKYMYDYLHENLRLPELEKPTRHTTLSGKLNTIDKLFDAINSGDGYTMITLLNALISDFPSSGSYWIDEAKQYKKVILEQFPELLN